MIKTKLLENGRDSQNIDRTETKNIHESFQVEWLWPEMSDLKTSTFLGHAESVEGKIQLQTEIKSTCHIK